MRTVIFFIIGILVVCGLMIACLEELPVYRVTIKTTDEEILYDEQARGLMLYTIQKGNNVLYRVSRNNNIVIYEVIGSNIIAIREIVISGGE